MNQATSSKTPRHVNPRVPVRLSDIGHLAPHRFLSNDASIAGEGENDPGCAALVLALVLGREAWNKHRLHRAFPQALELRKSWRFLLDLLAIPRIWLIFMSTDTGWSNLGRRNLKREKPPPDWSVEHILNSWVVWIRRPIPQGTVPPWVGGSG